MQTIEIYIFILLLVVQYTSPSESKISLSEKHERDKRSLIFRLNSATGILVAIAIPLDLPKQEVFMSYNFEANYNMPTVSQDIAPGIWQRLDLPGVTTEATPSDGAAAEGRGDNSNSGNNTESRKMKRNIGGTRNSLFSRIRTYDMLESKMNAAGLNGTECLLRAICDNAAIPVNKSNGILGDIIHIILSPSTSMDENLNQIFYEAESNGQMNENCEYIYKFCPASVFNRLTKIL